MPIAIWLALKIMKMEEFPGGPVFRALQFHH